MTTRDDIAFPRGCRYLVVRLPVLQEDEGRMHLVATAGTLAEAEAIVTKQLRDYFRRGDYQIVEVGHG